MAVHIGLAEGSKEISRIYLGSENSIKEISEGYISDTDGNVKEIYSSVEPGQRVFTTSGIFTVPDKVKKVDVFLVGGGGNGGCAVYHTNATSEYISYGGGGGAGGYTTTAKGIPVTPGGIYDIVVGSESTNNAWDTVYTGGHSTAFGYYANGGENACGLDSFPGNGGSGGGKDGYAYSIPTYHIKENWAGNGGYDGSSGYGSAATQDLIKNGGGSGQGTTTRAFGESSGTLYAGGGGGGTNTYMSSQGECHYGYGGAGGGGNGGKGPASVNTGGGGGGTHFNGYNEVFLQAKNGLSCYSEDGYGGKGGSGIVIIRWGY